MFSPCPVACRTGSWPRASIDWIAPSTEHLFVVWDTSWSPLLGKGNLEGLADVDAIYRGRDDGGVRRSSRASAGTRRCFGPGVERPALRTVLQDPAQRRCDRP